MRNILKNIDGERKTFRGEFVRFGSKSGYRKPVKTLLLKNIYDTDDKFITSHLWFNLTIGFEDLNLWPGDRVQFDARVKTYTKGYKGHLPDPQKPGKSIEKTDYKLSHPTKLKKL